jgi:hypothetical protein
MITPLPPTTIHTTTPIPSSSAHDFLSAYLDRATTDPALQPDASITEHGPTSRTTAAAPNLSLHNLKRVQAGLGGEVLGRDLLLEEDGTLREEDGPAENGAGGGTGDNDKDGGGGEWEEAKQYEQEQGQDGDGNEQADSGAVDKEERKRKKKERRLEEKRAKSGGGEA